MEFIIIFETNHKEEEMFIHYCQWTGNEVELRKFIKYIKEANFWELDGSDHSSLAAATNKRIPESAVDAHIGLRDPNGYDHMFQKHVGKFTCPNLDDDDDGRDEKDDDDKQAVEQHLEGDEEDDDDEEDEGEYDEARATSLANQLNKMFYAGGYFDDLFKKKKKTK
jgi:hypothetical protein